MEAIKLAQIALGCKLFFSKFDKGKLPEQFEIVS